MNAALAQPIPHADALTEPYWAGARTRKLMLPRCDACGAWHFYPRTLCPECGSAAITWREARGTGMLYSFTTVHRAPSPAFEPDVPYVVAVVALDEGPHLMSNLIGCEPARVTIGMRLKVAFRDLGEGALLPVFEPA